MAPKPGLNRQIVASHDDEPRWYAIHTKPQEETRAEMNLRAWEVETFAPRIRQLSRHPFAGQQTLVSKPLFSRYIFARFRVEELLHKIWFTRGVHSIVCCGGAPAPIDDEVIALIRSRIGNGGYVRMDDELKRGDSVIVESGPLKNLLGVFQKEMKQRVMILLSSVNYQGHLVIERQLVKKAG
jgi:transcriptional antiterminator RfaH